ncbi:hypothetical protein [Flavobacterium sp.]|jgi:hypothetical protein|uniref:hypothetical protein n=1 Tax=Flavobacterium sp. TaxID=239 RepID=UPI0037BF1895
MKYYIYAHINEKYGVFYVGKGSNNRLNITINRNDYWKRIVNKYGFIAVVLESCKTEDEAFKREIYWIDFYKKIGQCVANISLGGDGVRVDKRWWGSKISKSLTGIKRPSGKDSKSYKDIITKEELHDLYVVKKYSTPKIADMKNVSSTMIWERLKDYGIKPRSVHARGKAILCTTNGKEYKSITEAANELGVFRENVRKVLSGKYKSTGGFNFKYKG